MINRAQQINKQLKPDIHDVHEQNEQSLPGTFLSVMLLGAFLMATWITVFIIFIVRQ